MDQRLATRTDKARVIDLWHRSGLTRPWNSPEQDFDFALATPNAVILVIEDRGAILASAMVGHDGHRGSVYYVSTDPEARGRGLGRQVMQFAENWLKQNGIWKLNLLVRQQNAPAIGFYESLGYADQECISLGKRLDGRPDRSVETEPRR